MPYLKEGQLRQRVTPMLGDSEPEPEAQPQQYSASAAFTWIKTNWLYLVGVLGVLIIIVLLIYFYKKGVLFGAPACGSGIQYY